MDKVYVITPDNNKGKYITNGYVSAFKDLSYFVMERKIYDLNVDEIKNFKPHLIFCFWSEIKQNATITEFLNNTENKDIIYIHLAEKKEDIPTEFLKKEHNFCFYTDSKTKKNLILPCIRAKDYKTKFRGYKYSITFAGNPSYENREEILAKLIQNYGPINIFCRSFDFYKSLEDIEKKNLLSKDFLELYKVSYQGYVENQKELAVIYATSKINLDIANPNKKQINYRSLEILASGGFLLAEKTDPLVRQFEDGKEIETYKTIEELIDKIDFYKKNLNIAQAIIQNGKKNAISNHSYIDRLKKVLKTVYGKDISNR